MYRGVPYISYRTCTCYNCLPEDKPSSSKPVYVEDVKIEIKFNKGAFCWFTLHDYTGWTKSLCAPEDYNTESYKKCSKCPPSVSRYLLTRRIVFSKTVFSVARSTFRMYSVMAIFSSSIFGGLFEYTEFFIASQRKKSGGERSGDLGGQMVLEMVLSANTLSW